MIASQQESSVNVNLFLAKVRKYTDIRELTPEIIREFVERIEIFKPEQMNAMIDKKRYFPGWHMNKKHWYTIILDGSVSTEEICSRIDESYRLAK